MPDGSIWLDYYNKKLELILKEHLKNVLYDSRIPSDCKHKAVEQVEKILNIIQVEREDEENEL